MVRGIEPPLPLAPGFTIPVTPPELGGSCTLKIESVYPSRRLVITNSSTTWFAPVPSEIASSRISLDFGLRAADLFFRELVVPGVGRIWFARQLSWPLTALVLHKELASHVSNPPKPTAICHGIEALACKLQYWNDQPVPSQRILGRRAFGRDAERQAWSFHQLRQATNYVRNTHRQAATRAMRVDGGLGFASGSRFDLLEIEPVGLALANAMLEQRVGQGGTRLRRWLLEWIMGERKILVQSKTHKEALSPEHATEDEKHIVRSRLLETSSDACKKRQHLARAIGRAEVLPVIEDRIVTRLRHTGHLEQANEVVTARAFGAMLDRARDAVACLTDAVVQRRGSVPLAELASDSGIKKSIEDLRTASERYVDKANTAAIEEPTSRAFAKVVVAADTAETIRILVQRSSEVLGLADGFVTRGPLFRIVSATDDAIALEDGAASIEPDRTGRTFRIANYHSILREVDRRSPR